MAARRAKLEPSLEAWRAFCAELGEDPATVALAWLLHQEGVTAPIIGPRTMEQLEGALRAREIELSEDAPRATRRDLPRSGRSRAGSLRLVAQVRSSATAASLVLLQAMVPEVACEGDLVVVVWNDDRDGHQIVYMNSARP